MFYKISAHLHACRQGEGIEIREILCMTKETPVGFWSHDNTTCIVRAPCIHATHLSPFQTSPTRSLLPSPVMSSSSVSTSNPGTPWDARHLVILGTFSQWPLRSDPLVNPCTGWRAVAVWVLDEQCSFYRNCMNCYTSTEGQSALLHASGKGRESKCVYIPLDLYSVGRAIYDIVSQLTSVPRFFLASEVLKPYSYDIIVMYNIQAVRTVRIKSNLITMHTRINYVYYILQSPAPSPWLGWGWRIGTWGWV